ncbi:hypothetical protein [Glaciibacter sp. 2TAF33]|uniref:hypothetical protein n=1 Tax=Glaciibacter sp. 2TAF33 TaxID=3233015 RepID=UPI003F9351DC
MMRIFHTGGSILTGSDIGSALMDYSNALPSRRTNDLVDIPIIDEGGVPVRAQLTVGYGSPLVSVPASVDTPELVDPDEVDFLASHTTPQPVQRGEPMNEENLALITELGW